MKRKRFFRKFKAIFVLPILLIVFCVSGIFINRALYAKDTKAEMVESTKQYMKDMNLQFDESVSIPVYMLYDAEYLSKFDEECIDSSYVIVTNNNGEYTYNPVIVCDDSKSIIKLNGEAIQEVEVGEDYIEQGASTDGNSGDQIIIDNTVDTNKTGTYGLNYVIPNSDMPPVLRIIKVVDKTSPVLTLKGSDIVYILAGDTYAEQGYKAIDNYDGDITANVSVSGSVDTSIVGSYFLTYTISDSSNNTTTVKRKVIVKENIPIIKLFGYATAYVNVFEDYIEDGYVANDDRDGNITKKVIVEGYVNTSVVGEYILTYKVTNSNGASVIVRRLVEVVDNTKPVITLNGNSTVTLEWGQDSYNELGAVATDNYDGNITNKIQVTGVFSPNKIGSYYLTYSVTDSSGNKSIVQRNVKVVDSGAPIVTLIGDSTIYIEANATYNELGATVSDNHDTNIAINISGSVNTSIIGTYKVSYVAIDSSNNVNIKERTVVVRDTTKPVITLRGNSTVNIELGSSYVELGANATDNYDHFVDNNIVINGSVNPLVEGTYYITYDVTDSATNVANQVTRTVIVKDTTKPLIELTSSDAINYVNSASIQIKINDQNNDIKDVKYAWSTTLDPTVYTDYTYTENTVANLSFTSNGTYYLYVTASDLSGNISIEHIGPFKIDTIKPTVTIAPISAIGQTITTSISALDEFSGINNIYYAWSDNNVTEPSNYNIYVNSLTLTADGTYYLWAKAIDKAGNEKVSVSETFIVDNVLPTITFAYPSSTVVKNITLGVNASANGIKTISKLEYTWTTNNVQPSSYTDWDLVDYTNSHNITMPNNTDGTYYLWVKATDSLGLISYTSSNALTLDNTLPTISIDSNGSVTPIKGINVGVNVTEANKDTVLYEISTESDISKVTLTNTLSDTINIQGLNGTYYLHIAVTDKAGNYQDFTSLPFTFDNTAPINPTISYNTSWTNQSIEVTINGTDNIVYSLDNNTWFNYEASNKPSINANTTIYAKTSDVAGNTSEVVSSTITNIDKEKANIILDYETTLTKKINVDYEITDNLSGVKEIYYAWTTDLTEPTFVNPLSDLTGTIAKDDVSGNYYLWMKVIDNALNETITKTTLLSLDKDLPVVQITSGNGTTFPVNSQDTIFNISDTSSMDIQYIWTTSSTELAYNANWTTWNYSDVNNSLQINNSTPDGIYYLHVKATDAALNKTYVISNSYTIVNSNPTVTLDPATNLDYAKEINSQATVVMPNATITNLYYAWSTSSNALDVTSWDSFNSGDTLTKNDATGAYYLYIKVVDNVNGSRTTITKSSGTFNLDITKVNISFSPNGTSTDPVRKAETVITATDSNSGVATIKYAWSTNGIVAPDLSLFSNYTTNEILSKETINTLETWYVWTYSVDGAGNTSYDVSNAFVIDNSYPDVTLNPNRSNPVNSVDVQVGISVDTNKTLTNIYYAWDTKATTSDTTSWVTWDLIDYANNNILSQTGLNGTYYLHVKVIDSNNLVATKSSYEIIMDNTNPVVTVTPDSSLTPVKEITAHVSVNELNDYDVFYSFTQESNSTLVTYQEWTTFMGQGTDTLNFKDLNGTYYLYIKVVDEAGNISYINKKYVLDNIAPTNPTIDYNNAWTNSGVSITLNGLEIVQYSFDETTWYDYDALNKPLITTNGTTIYARSKDVAGNISSTTSTLINNIDSDAPVVSLVPSTTTLTNNDVTISVNTTSELSPIVSVRWSEVALTKAEFALDNGHEVDLVTKNFNVTSNQAYIAVYVKDAAGNETIAMTSVSNIDKELPVITVNPSTVTIDEDTVYNVLSGVSATDNVGLGSNEITYNSFNTSTPGTFIITYSLTDLAGNTASSSRTINVLDKTAPVISMNGDSVVNIEVYGSYTELGATSLDNYDSSTTVITSGSVDTTKLGTYTISYKATDAALNSSTVTRTVNVVDTTKPVISLNGSATINLEVHATYNELGVVITDNYDIGLTANISSDLNKDVVGTYTVTYNVKDTSGNIADTVTKTINVIDTTKPVITLNGSATIDLEVHATYNELGVTITDNYDTNLTAVIDSNINKDVVGSYIVTYNVTDGNGNIADTVTRTVNVVDTTKPVITLNGLATITLEVNSSYNELGTVVTDNYDASLIAVISGSVDTTKVGSYTITYSAIDAAGNTQTATRTINVVDTTKPVITLNGSATIDLEVYDTYNELGTVVTDNYDTNLIATISGSVDTTKVGIYTITYNVTDANGNIADTVTRTINVVDTTKPVITLNGLSSITLEVNSTYNELGANVTDNYSTGLSVSIVGTVDTTKVGVYTIKYVSQDEAGNNQLVSRVVNIVDTTAPVITLNGSSSITLEVNSTYNELGSIVTDNYDTNLIAIISGSVDTTKVGIYTLSYNATDANGNIADTITRTVNIVDTTKPVITLNGNTIISVPVGSTYTDSKAIVTDNYDSSYELIGTGIVNTMVVGNYDITYNATDANGNVADTVTRKVIVTDEVAPIINVNGDKTMNIEVYGSYTELGAIVVDNYDTNLTVSISGSVDTSVLGTYTITYTVTDSNNNTSVETRTINVVDTTKPVISLTGDATINLTLGDTYTELGASVTDNYYTNINAEVTNNINVNIAGTYTVTYKAKDGSNNETTLTRTVIVNKEEISSIFTEISGCTSGTSCYVSGSSSNNYVWYSGYLWRMYKLNTDDSIKLITEGSVASLSYDETSAYYNDSVVENWLNGTFYSSLNNANGIVLSNASWCNLNTADANNSRTTCTVGSVVNSNVGLLTLFEYNLLGGKTSFVNNGDKFFTMTIYNTSSVWSIDNNGDKQAAEMTYNVQAIRPVVTLSSNAQIIKGDGSETNPYRIESDNSATPNTSLNNRFTGEYVNFNSQLWRIVTSDNGGTRLILDSFLKDSNGNIIETAYGLDNTFSLTSTIGSILNTYYGNVNGLVNNAWYEGTYAWGQNPIGTSIANSSYVDSKFGLIRVGELMSGKSETLNNSGKTYWTMTKNANGQVWHISTTGGASYSNLSDLRAVRPVVKVDSSFTIKSGSGTYTNPYTLN